MTDKKSKRQPIETKIITGVGRALWALVSLPFRRKKSGDVAECWKEVQELMAKDNTHAWAMAIMKADSILDSVLIRLDKSSRDKTMGERLKNMEGKIDRGTLQSAWDAHKVRNHIAHGDGNISHPEAQDTIANFRRVLNELNEL